MGVWLVFDAVDRLVEPEWLRYPLYYVALSFVLSATGALLVPVSIRATVALSSRRRRSILRGGRLPPGDPVPLFASRDRLQQAAEAVRRVDGLQQTVLRLLHVLGRPAHPLTLVLAGWAIYRYRPLDVPLDSLVVPTDVLDGVDPRTVIALASLTLSAVPVVVLLALVLLRPGVQHSVRARTEAVKEANKHLGRLYGCSRDLAWLVSEANDALIARRRPRLDEHLQRASGGRLTWGPEGPEMPPHPRHPRLWPRAGQPSRQAAIEARLTECRKVLTDIHEAGLSGVCAHLCRPVNHLLADLGVHWWDTPSSEGAKPFRPLVQHERIESRGDRLEEDLRQQLLSLERAGSADLTRIETVIRSHATSIDESVADELAATAALSTVLGHLGRRMVPHGWVRLIEGLGWVK